jgi:helix-turn-helix protein
MTPATTTPTPGNIRKAYALSLVLVSGKRETVTYSARSAAEARTRANNRNEVERVLSVEEVVS